MLTAGIDLASQPARTAVCLIDWSGPRVVEHRLVATDANLLALVAGADRTGIDAPLGWPVAFVRALRDDAWPEDRTPLVHRATDRWVRAETGKVPLSVSTDRIAYCAMRAAALLARIDGADRSGLAGPVCETYPDPSLARLGLRAATRASYKREAVDARRAIVDALPPWLGGLDRAACVASDDLLDALVCALVARAALLGRTVPPPAEVTDVAQVEGWIHLPQRMSVDELR